MVRQDNGSGQQKPTSSVKKRKLSEVYPPTADDDIANEKHDSNSSIPEPYSGKPRIKFLSQTSYIRLYNLRMFGINSDQQCFDFRFPRGGKDNKTGKTYLAWNCKYNSQHWYKKQWQALKSWRDSGFAGIIITRDRHLADKKINGPKDFLHINGAAYLSMMERLKKLPQQRIFYEMLLSSTALNPHPEELKLQGIEGVAVAEYLEKYKPKPPVGLTLSCLTCCPFYIDLEIYKAYNPLMGTVMGFDALKPLLFNDLRQFFSEALGIPQEYVDIKETDSSVDIGDPEKDKVSRHFTLRINPITIDPNLPPVIVLCDSNRDVGAFFRSFELWTIKKYGTRENVSNHWYVNEKPSKRDSDLSTGDTEEETVTVGDVIKKRKAQAKMNEESNEPAKKSFGIDMGTYTNLRQFRGPLCSKRGNNKYLFPVISDFTTPDGSILDENISKDEFTDKLLSWPLEKSILPYMIFLLQPPPTIDTPLIILKAFEPDGVTAALSTSNKYQHLTMAGYYVGGYSTKRGQGGSGLSGKRNKTMTEASLDLLGEGEDEDGNELNAFMGILKISHPRKVPPNWSGNHWMSLKMIQSKKVNPDYGYSFQPPLCREIGERLVEHLIYDCRIDDLLHVYGSSEWSMKKEPGIPNWIECRSSKQWIKCHQADTISQIPHQTSKGITATNNNGFGVSSSDFMFDVLQFRYQTYGNHCPNILCYSLKSGVSPGVAFHRGNNARLHVDILRKTFQWTCFDDDCKDMPVCPLPKCILDEFESRIDYFVRKFTKTVQLDFAGCMRDMKDNMKELAIDNVNEDDTMMVDPDSQSDGGDGDYDYDYEEYQYE